jgi:hypothetical protein
MSGLDGAQILDFYDLILGVKSLIYQFIQFTYQAHPNDPNPPSSRSPRFTLPVSARPAPGQHDISLLQLVPHPSS